MHKPTIQEITDFCKERGNYVDPEQFYYFYESKGWKVGRSAMKSWQACVRTWERNTTHSMAVRGRDEAVRASQAVYKLPVAKPKVANPRILELNKEMFALTGGLRGATASQRIQINIKVRAIRKEIQTIKDGDSKLTLDISK